jgi:hypothetical protein
MSVWSREGQDTRSTLSVRGQQFIGAGIIRNTANSCNPPCILLYIMLYMLQPHMDSQVFKGLKNNQMRSKQFYYWIL